MVGNYIRNSNRQGWSEEAMQRAIGAVNNGEAGWLKASKLYGVPQATLRRRAQNKNLIATGTKKQLGRFQQTFSADLEREIVDHIKLLESRLFGLSSTDLRKLAYDLAHKNGIEHRFNTNLKMAGWDWLAGFRKRNPDIALRKPEPTSKARAMGFNRPQVSKFFTTYQEILEKHNISPTRIFNVDESALSTVQKPPKVFAQTGKKQVGALTSAERGIHVTMVCCMSTTGHFIPPALIFPRKRWKQELIDGAPLGTLGLYQENGWMNSELFLRWLQHFKKFANPTISEKVLLIVDGHSSHKGYEVLTFAKNNGIVILSLPAHCTHRMQPLDVTFYGPMKTYYNQEISLWLKAHPDRVLSQYQIARLFGQAYSKTAQTAIAESGFLKTGIWPVNPDIFPDHLFSPSETTNIRLKINANNSNEEIDNALRCTNNGNADNEIERSESPEAPRPMQTTDKSPHEKENMSEEEAGGSSCSSAKNDKKLYKFSVDQLSPVPQTISTTSRKRKATVSQELTGTPNMDDLKFQQLEKSEKDRNKELRHRAKETKKRLDLPGPSVDFVTANKDKKNELRRTARETKKICVPSQFESDSDTEEDPFKDDDYVDDAACLYCNSLFSKSRSREKWIKCMKCQNWAHCECADVSVKTKTYICEICV